MSFSLALRGGDLVQSGSELTIVSGVEKLEQDLQLWVAERYGIDRFHPGMGSRLQDFIGGVIGYSTRSRVYNEIIRVLNNYQKVQYQSLRQSPTLFSLSELLWSVNDVQVGVGFDTVSVAVNVSNAEQQPTTIAINQGS